MGGQGLLVFIGLKVLVMMTSLQNIVISGAQGLLMLMGSKFFGKDDQAVKHQGLLVLIGLKVLVMMTSLQNIVISGAQGLLMLMGSKFW